MTLRKDKDRRMAPSFSSSALPHQDTRDTNLDFAVAKDTLLYSGKANSLCAYRAGSDQVFHKARRRMDGLELAFEIIHMGVKMLRAQWGPGCISHSEPLYPDGPEDQSHLRNLIGGMYTAQILQTTCYRNLEMTPISCLKAFHTLPRLHRPERSDDSCATCAPSRLGTTVLGGNLLGAICRRTTVVLFGAQWALSCRNSVKQ